MKHPNSEKNLSYTPQLTNCTHVAAMSTFASIMEMDGWLTLKVLISEKNSSRVYFCLSNTKYSDRPGNTRAQFNYIKLP